MINLPSTKEEARELGETRFYTGVRCKRNHLALRSVSNGRCIECSKYLKKRQAIKDKKLGRKNWSKNSYDYETERSKTSKIPWARKALQSARSRAKQKGIECNISFEDVYNLCIDYCPILNIKLNYVFGGKRYARYDSPSIDRIDSNKGYIKENIIVVSFRANTLHQDATVGELRKLLEFYESKN